MNNTFYNLPDAHVFADWAERTPDDFVVTVKMSRFLTHIKRLREPKEPVERFFERAEKLGSKLGPVLLQLPPGLRADPDRLDAALREMPARTRTAVEFRDDSWYSDDVRRVLESHRAALVWADRRGPLDPPWRTAAWGFVRFHQGRAQPPPCYGRRALASWLDRLRDAFSRDEDVYVYFNNDHKCCAVRDAIVFARAAERAGLEVSRVATVSPSPAA